MNASSQMPSLLVIDPNKISLYLLNIRHADGGSKAKFFLGWGFHPSRPNELNDALIAHVCRPNFVGRDDSYPYGPRFIYIGPMMAPHGVTPNVRSIWEVLHGTDFGKFITAHPA